jgi:hypothetical protein
VLRARIKHWELIRGVYMPGLQRLQIEQERSPSDTRAEGFNQPPMSNHPEHVDLWLPSSLSPNTRRSICSVRLIAIEERLRTAQCSDALESLRHILRVKSRMVLFKHKNVRGQREGTRSRSVIDRVHARARAAASKYRLARLAKLSLSGPGVWENTLRVLLDSDIRAYSDPDKMRVSMGRRGTVEDPGILVMPDGLEPKIDLRGEARGRRDGTGETRRTLSWIWRVEGFAIGEEEAEDDILRSEWAKSRARANRANEEVLLIREEMRRTLEFLNWKAQWWEERGKLRTPLDKGSLEGLQAYSMEQAALQRQLHEGFKSIWKQPLQDVEEEEEEKKRGDAGEEEGDIHGDDDEAESVGSDDDGDDEDAREDPDSDDDE